MVDSNGVQLEEVGELTANWGCGSKMDGITHHLDMCESCFQVAFSALKEHRRSTVMFDDEQDLPDENMVNNPLSRGRSLANPLICPFSS